MSTQLFESALGIKAPWSVKSVDFDEAAKRLTVLVDFAPGTRFPVNGHPGQHPVHDTVTKTYRHLNFFQHECHLQVRVPRVRLPHGAVRLVDPDFAGRLNGFTLLFEALILMLAQQMPFRAVGRIVGESEYRVLAVCRRYVHIAGGLADYSAVTSLAIDETSRSRGHQYVTLAADADARRVVFVGQGRGSGVIAELAEHLDWHGCPPQQIERVSIDMSAAYIKGVGEHLPDARITFDKFHVIAHASAAVDKTRRIEQRADPAAGAMLKGLRWTLLKDAFDLKPQAGAALHALITAPRLTLTARAWTYKERLRLAMEHKQVNVLRRLLQHWCGCVMRSKVDVMKEVAAMVRKHLEGIVAWAQTRQTNGFLEAINGLFQAAKRRARGYGSFDTIKTVIFLIAGKLNFQAINPHVGQPT
ncbi:ISL3 family transposase [Piscinibacter defluvii]|uniref:ISL3 family transposase n=1 Tax=Piscinibacter defluvii TaxID=1796922 RepID=UPI000FDD0D38|nr:ISL3 family transposase [Piscinibacter defluvii]